MAVIGYLILFILGKGLPQADYDPNLTGDKANDLAFEANRNDEFWRFIFILPIFINLFMILSVVFYIKSDPIMYNVSRNNYNEALELIDKVYHPSEDRNLILENLKL